MCTLVSMSMSFRFRVAVRECLVDANGRKRVRGEQEEPATAEEGFLTTAMVITMYARNPHSALWTLLIFTFALETVQDVSEAKTDCLLFRTAVNAALLFCQESILEVVQPQVGPLHRTPDNKLMLCHSSNTISSAPGAKLHETQLLSSLDQRADHDLQDVSSDIKTVHSDGKAT